MDFEYMRHCNERARAILAKTASSAERSDLRSGGETGGEYMHRLINIHPRLCHEQLRLTAPMLVRLVDIMISRELLQDTNNVSVTEQIGMCLYILGKGASFRHVADTFKHSISTVSKYFHLVLEALNELSFDIIRPHTPMEEVPQKIQSSSLYFPFFKDAVGAIDGTHIKAVLQEDRSNSFRSRKGTTSWNVLACCSFDMLFSYVHVGWEGSAHDQTVWKDSLTNAKYCFPHPPTGKYYLVDSGYPNTIGYLAPYMNVEVPHNIPDFGNIGRSARYHMPEFRHGIEPVGIYEHFNYRHSSLRTTIERCFGVLKNTWRVLHLMPKVSEEKQIMIIMATLTLHNFMGMEKRGIPILTNELVEGRADSGMYDANRKNQMKIVRDSIAADILCSTQNALGEDNMDDL